MRVHSPTLFRHLKPGDHFHMNDGSEAVKIDEVTWEYGGGRSIANPDYLCYPLDWDDKAIRSFTRTRHYQKAGKPWYVEALVPKDFIMAEPDRLFIRVDASRRYPGANPRQYYLWLDNTGRLSGVPTQLSLDDAVTLLPMAKLSWPPPDYAVEVSREAYGRAHEAIDHKDFIMKGPVYYTAKVVWKPEVVKVFGGNYDRWLNSAGGLEQEPHKLVFSDATGGRESFLKTNVMARDVDIQPADNQNQMYWQGKRWPEDFNESELLIALEAEEEKQFIMQQRIPFVVRIKFKWKEGDNERETKWAYMDYDGAFYEDPPNVMKFETTADACQVYERNLRRFTTASLPSKVEYVPVTAMEQVGESVDVQESRKDVLIGSVVAVYKNKVALVKGKNGWTLPGGRTDGEESVFHAAARECEEECGIEVKPADLLFVGMVQRSKHRIDSIFVVELEKEQAAKAGSDADEAMWVSMDNLPRLGFGHAAAIKKALRVLRMKPEERGQLVVFEGVDGAGKTTQVERTIEWLKKHGFPVITTKWASSPLMGGAIKKGKKKRELSPVLYHLMHSADLLHRYEQIVCPALKRNFVVVCDRYWPTGVVRDRLRGVKDKACYAKLRKPDLLFYCAVQPETAVKRLMKAGRLSWYGIGMDLAYADDEHENALEYSKRMARLYQRVLPARHVALHMDRKVDKIWDDVKAKLERVLDDHYYRGQNLTEKATLVVCQLLEMDVKRFVMTQRAVIYNIVGVLRQNGQKVTYCYDDGWTSDMMLSTGHFKKWRGGANQTEQWVKILQGENDPVSPAIMNIRGELELKEAIDPRQEILHGKNHWELTLKHQQQGDTDEINFLCNGVSVGTYFIDNERRSYTARPDERLLRYWKDQIEALDSRDQFHPQDSSKHGFWEWQRKHDLQLDIPAKFSADQVYADDRQARLKLLGWLPESEIDVKDFIVRSEPDTFRVGGTDEEGVRRYISSERTANGDWTSDATKSTLYTRDDADVLVADLVDRMSRLRHIRAEPVVPEPKAGYWRWAAK